MEAAMTTTNRLSVSLVLGPPDRKLNMDITNKI